METTATKTKHALKKGLSRFYFPEHPDHPLNGAFAHATSAYCGEIDGKKCRRVIETFENSRHNNSVDSGHWEGEFNITADDFNSDKVLVKHWWSDEYENMETYYFYLVKY